MDNISKINNLISEFNTLIARRDKAEKWFDEITTTDTNRLKWEPSIINMSKDIEIKAKQLEVLEFVMQEKFYWYGIGGEK